MAEHWKSIWAAAALFAVVTATGAAQAQPLQDVAWVWANQAAATTTYSPHVGYGFNSTSGSITVGHLGTGEYEVDLTGFADITADNVQVTAYGTNDYCDTTGWGGEPHPSIGVACFAPDGTPKNAKFTLLYQQRSGSVGTASDGVAFLWADSKKSASYTPNPSYQYNSTGGTNTVSRSGKGLYTAHLPGFSTKGGHAQVTAYSTTNHCGVESWKVVGPGTDVNIVCVNVAGKPADSEYNLSFSIGTTAGQVGIDTPGLYVLTNHAQKRNYKIPAPRAFNGLSGAPKIAVQRHGTGQYEVSIPSASISSLTVLVTGVNTGGTYCNVAGMGEAAASVACFNKTGLAADSEFDLTFQTSQ